MPIIDLPKKSASTGATAYFYPVLSVMLYPRNDALRAQWLAAAMVGAHHDGKDDLLSDFPIGVLWDLKQAPQRAFRDGWARASRADLSGHLLLYLLRLAKHHPQHCKLERAKALVVRFAAHGDETISESLITKTWAEFKTVSHLWAAFDQLVRHGWSPDSNGRVATLLSRAESIRMAAENARLLAPGKSWQAPQIELPNANAIEPLPLEDDLIEFLKQDFPS